MRDGEDLGSMIGVLCIDHCVGKPIKVVDTHSVLTVRTALLVLDEKVTDSLVLGEEGFGNHPTRMRRVVDRGVAEFSFSLRMNPSDSRDPGPNARKGLVTRDHCYVA